MNVIPFSLLETVRKVQEGVNVKKNLPVPTVTAVASATMIIQIVSHANASSMALRTCSVRTVMVNVLVNIILEGNIVGNVHPIITIFLTAHVSTHQFKNMCGVSDE